MPATDISLLKDTDGNAMDGTEVVAQYLRALPDQTADPVASVGASMESAATTVAHDALTGLLPLQQATLDAALKASLAQVPDGQTKSDGMRIGSEAAGHTFYSGPRPQWRPGSA